MPSEKTEVKGVSRSGSPKRVVLSEDLFSGNSEVMIKHKSDFYRLLITKAGKLILNK